MKTHLLAMAGLIAGCLLIIAPSPCAAADKATLTKTFNEGVAAFKKGDLDIAETRFRAVQKQIPREPKSARYLNAIRNKRLEIAKVPQMQKQLATIRVPKVEFEEATLEEALEFVRLRSKELSGGKIVPNFIVRAGTSGIDKKEFNLNLSNIPMSEVLTYIGRLADTKFEYQKFAIVAKPLFTRDSGPPKVAAPKADGPAIRAQ